MNASPLYILTVGDNAQETSVEHVFSMLIERHNSFENFPIDNTALINSLIVNGFRYEHVDDAVACEYCNVVIKNWCEDDCVEFVHATLSPYCVYANKIAQSEQFSGDLSTDAILVSPGKPRCVYSRLAHPSARRATFEEYWPAALQHLIPSIAEAGMFHTKLGDETACFFCDYRVRNWLPGDDPWRRHAIANPQCYFVVCIKGEHFYETAHPSDDAPLAESVTTTINTANETLECKICLERQRDTVLLPCRHFCVCMQCYFALDGKCPACRQDVTDFLKIFVT
ncbi:inhibitor of apoptosis protein 1 [Anticarsia gemmatalis nucleopolyhedrovirus]|uniref:Inhibitor of apoptosis protein 1 n=1 Tax=Anticarsia gemmatalis multiple nucleopolyhedrovirus TaxID=268591 RepID=A0A0S3IVG0_9ABAC|nr:inhibitor of apoptosis protein 1 [Anticarsia gemmatalis nucleopolyhedrovirus]ABI13824.1 inhibitor of apoptosis protein 1 [Anticarsia gemmatalis multiple nucleopolyhedrovirus]ALR69928.1 inhibitor of apoptosis protein 1 [Anticarsia gemmatalis multiple nucleopolyhedrovirus]ALR70243.1 inhibitor of apoptosis protein 1 [Anticarsia gemmatalis multiple nucleopolyhedrovirus]ALR70713.1 inhibitor of apoptosis protein 1 [Anticarsia gemmatalis multiple nucleopolyhedrovirus]ALR71185.1 inhibitor of apopto